MSHHLLHQTGYSCSCTGHNAQLTHLAAGHVSPPLPKSRATLELVETPERNTYFSCTGIDNIYIKSRKLMTLKGHWMSCQEGIYWGWKEMRRMCQLPPNIALTSCSRNYWKSWLWAFALRKISSLNPQIASQWGGLVLKSLNILNWSWLIA